VSSNSSFESNHSVSHFFAILSKRAKLISLNLDTYIIIMITDDKLYIIVKYFKAGELSDLK
jgi:hypothetical protein